MILDERSSGSFPIFNSRFSIFMRRFILLLGVLLAGNYMSYAHTKAYNSPYGSFSTYAALNPYERIYDENGELIAKLSDGTTNPLYDAFLPNRSFTKMQEFTEQLSVDWFIRGTVLQFYAKGGNLESNSLEVTIRELPKEDYEEIVIPVVFHVLVPPATATPSYDLSVEFLEEQLQRVSDAFNRKITTDPNAGNAKVVFKLATYDQNGLKMQEPGA